jgi:hypothetical protein
VAHAPLWPAAGGFIASESKLGDVMTMNETNDNRSKNAYEAVLSDLRSRLAATPAEAAHPLIERAIEALEALERATAHGTSSIGAPTPGSEAEIAEEVEKEKLDP